MIYTKLISGENYVKEGISSFYKVILGPSSSHTFGVYEIARRIRTILENKEFSTFKIHFYGSIAQTGVGHYSDKALFAGLQNIRHLENPERVFQSFEILTSNNYDLNIPGKSVVFNPDNQLIWHKNEPLPTGVHPNTIVMELDTGDLFPFSSVGGGKVLPTEVSDAPRDIPANYRFANFRQFSELANQYPGTLLDFVTQREVLITGSTAQDIYTEIEKKYGYMIKSVESGLARRGHIPGGLTDYRAWKLMYDYVGLLGKDLNVSYADIAKAAAMACAEHNASGGIIVTTPTAGGGGVLPGVLYALKYNGVEDDKLIKSLYIAGIIGAIIEANATISGAKGGCAFEIGAGMAMAAASRIYAKSEDSVDNKRTILSMIDQACASVYEHHGNLPCDPVGGRVEIPCIERNGDGAYSVYGNTNRVMVPNPHFQFKVHFDHILQTRYQDALLYSPPEHRECGANWQTEVFI